MAIANLTNSVNKLGLGIGAANSSVKSIQNTLKGEIKFKKASIRISNATFFKRRDAVRRREKEGILEASTLGGASSRMNSVIGQSTKGFLGRIADFLGAMLVAWAVKNLPIIINTIRGIIDKIRRVSKVLGDFVRNTTDFLSGMITVVNVAAQNLFALDFTDSEGRLNVAIDEMNSSFDLMGQNIDSAFEILKEPIDYTGLEKAAAGEEQTEEQTVQGGDPSGTNQGQVQPGTSTSPAPGGSAVYTSQGGQKLIDRGGQDYGDYGAGRMGSRGSARVHGADGIQRGHTGEDYAMPVGKPLTMIAKGTVVDVGLGNNGGYGNFVVVQLENGMYVKMAHLDKVYVKKGQRVGAGSAPGGRAVVIGTSGNTGLSSGPHLHLDYSKEYNPASAMSSKTVNPKNFINNGGLVIGSNVKATGKQGPPPAPASSISSKSKVSQSSTGGGSVSPQEVYSYLKGKGLSHNHIMGIVAGIDGESSFRIGIQEQGHTKEGVGLFQYTYPSRKQAFLQAVPNYKENWKGQVDYAIDKDPETKSYLGRQFESPESAAEWWLVQWERPLESLRSSRREKYRQFISGFQPGNISSGSLSVPNLQMPNTSNAINVPMPSMPQVDVGGAAKSVMNSIGDAGNALNTFITHRFLNSL
jgi:murein DD-endopeptidase MepM/ murein hydrolase activator NlpD